MKKVVLLIVLICSLLYCYWLPDMGILSQAELNQDKDYRGNAVEITTYDTEAKKRKIVFHKIPQRVVLDIVSDLETLLALGQGNRVALTSVRVGSASYKQLQERYPEEIKKVQQFSTHNLNMETVMAAQPDFVIGWKSTFSPSWLRTTSWWDKRGVNTYIVANSNKTVPEGTIAEECQYLRDMGRIFNVEAKAQAYIDEIEAEIERTKKETHGRKPQTVMVIELTKRYIINYDSHWLVGDMVKTLGGTMPVEALRLGQEDLIYYDPDVILVSGYNRLTEDGVKFLQQDPKFQSMQAVKNGRVYPIRFNLMYATTVRTAEGLRAIKHSLYPDLQQ